MCMCMWSPATGKQDCASTPSHSPRLGPDLATSNHSPLTLALALALGSAPYLNPLDGLKLLGCRADVGVVGTGGGLLACSG